MVRVGLVGCGTIGSRLALTVEREYASVARLVALHDINPTHARFLQQRLHRHPPIASLPVLLRKSQLVLEAASVDAVGPLVRTVLQTHRSVLVMSVGGLLRDTRWQRLVRRSRGHVYIPSGALAGLDGVKALAVGCITRAVLTTRKPPRALADAPYVRAKHLQLSRLRRPRLIFEGSPREVVHAFPQNTNVAAALALASGSAQHRARIRVIADPAVRVNSHELEVEGDCGRIQCRVQSRPSDNPRTSELAVRSAIVALRRIFDVIAIGT